MQTPATPHGTHLGARHDDTILLIGHGSRESEGNDEIHRFVAQWRARQPALRIEVCFSEFAAPSLHDGLLAAAGVPILRALQTAAETLSNQAMRADALDALVLVREGAPLASALAQKKRFPGLVSMFARLGEQTGQLPLMLQRAATQISTEVQRRSLQLATILEPLLIVSMGLIVMTIVLAVMQPIIELNRFVK